MTRKIKREKQHAASIKLMYARQSRDVTCNPICPGSEIAVREDNPGPYRELLGQRLRVGYYSRQDGLNVIWIVYPNAEYGQTMDHSDLREFFKVIVDSGDTDYYGVNRPILEPL
jgi:hypothetical protein